MAVFLGGIGESPGQATPDIMPGVIDGSFEVSPQGSASYTVPIKCPPGSAGMSPRLSFAYNSQAGTGSMGPGWSIAGYSVITRGPKNLDCDGVVEGVKFTLSDALFLNGTRLIPVARANDNSFVEYRSEVDTYSRVRGYGNSPTGYDYFVVWTKAGLILYFGNTVDSRPMRADGAPLLWMCSRIEDTCGNFIRFAYELHPGGDYDIKRVEYTGNGNARIEPYAAVDFNYEPLAEISTTHGKGLPIVIAYLSGEKIFKSFRLKTVTSRFMNRVMRSYDLGYKSVDTAAGTPETPTDSLCGFRLLSLTESGEDSKRYRPTEFRYTDSITDTPAWKVIPTLQPPIDFSADIDASSRRFGIRYADLNADGRSDLIFSAMVNGQLQRQTYLSTPSGWQSTDSFKLPVPLTSFGRAADGIVIRDINGDGRADVLVNQIHGKQLAFINGPNGWEDKPGFIPPVTLSARESEADHYLLLDLEGNGKLDFIWNDKDTGSQGAKRQGPNGWEDLSPGFAPPLPIGGNLSFTVAMDVNKDGKDDLIYFPSGEQPRVYLAGARGWELQDSLSPYRIRFLSPTGPSGIQIADLFGDGRKELIASYTVNGLSVEEVIVATPNGWQIVDSKYNLPVSLLNEGGIAQGVKLVDINGDGRVDLLVYTVFANTGHVVRHAYLNKASGWEETPQFLPPYPMAVVPAGSAKLVELPVFLANVDGTVGEDLIYQSSVQGTYASIPNKATLLSSPVGWQPSADFAPPTVIAEHEKRDLGVRFVDFNSDGLADVIATYKAKNGVITQIAKMNTLNGWEDAPPKWRFPYPTAEEQGDITGIQFVDVSGDGRVDAIIHRLRRDGSVEKHAYVNDPNDPDKGWREDPGWNCPIPITQDGKGDLGVRFIDLNGDGLTDIIAAYQTLDGKLFHRAFLNTGAGWLESSEFENLPSNVAFAQEFNSAGANSNSADNIVSKDNAVLITDINGDGLPDIVFNYDALHPLPSPSNTASPNNVTGLDASNPTIVKGALINTGRGWLVNSTYTPPHRLDAPKDAKTQYYELQDLNGDGLMDLLYVHYDQANGNQSEAYLNTGRGWEASTSSGWRIPDSAFQRDAVSDQGSGDHGIRFIDVNGDGLVDMLQSYRIDANTTVSHAWLNNGTTWIESPNFIPSVPGTASLAFAQKDGADTGVRPVDVNGDLISDLLVWRKNEDGSQERAALVNQSARRDILARVINGAGLEVSFAHRLMTRGQRADGTVSAEAFGDFYTPSLPGSYPIYPAPPPVLAVETVKLLENPGTELQSFRYRYGGFRVNARRRLPLGFAWRETINEKNGMAERTETSQQDSPYLVGSITRDSTRYNKQFTPPTPTAPTPGALRSQISNDWDVTLFDGLPNTSGKPFKFAQISIKSSISTSCDLDGSVLGLETSVFEYDKWGNAIRVHTERSDGSGADILSEYSNDVVGWHLGRLFRAETAMFNRAGERQLRAASFLYDERTGLLKSEVSDANSPEALKTIYDYDVFGNTVFKDSETAAWPSRASSFRFDALGRFPIETSDALHHTSFAEYDPLFGNIVTATDPNRLTVRSEYGSDGLLAAQEMPTGVRATWVRNVLAKPIPLVGLERTSYAISEAVTKVGELPPRTQLVDAEGHILRVITIGPSGRRVFQDTEYDELKRLRRESNPYFEGTDVQHIKWTATDYDVLDRPRRITSPDKEVTRFEYKGFVTTKSDKLNRKTVTVYNLRNLPVSVTDANKGTILYEYDVGDRIRKVVNADHTETRYTYDNLGRKTDLYDPDLGHWKYRYNAFGELVWQQDAKKQQTKFQYDQVGRLIRRDAVDSWAIWEYDAAAYGIGKLASLRASDGYQESYVFDRLGRAIEAKTNVVTEEFVFKTTYDKYNRRVAITYPTGFRIRNHYDKTGMLRSVSNDQTSKMYWEASQFDVDNHVVEQSLGNGVKSQFGYDSATGRLETLSALGSKGELIENLQYTYDAVGNIKTRNDRLHHSNQHFGYDSLDRLVSTSIGGNIIQSQRYGAAGSIEEKSDVGTYRYGDGSRKGPAHGVIAIENKGEIEGSYTYDGNGNLTSSPSLTKIAYTAGNVPRFILSKTNAWSEFAYNPSGDKYWQEMRDGAAWVRTIYLGAYERTREEMVSPWLPTNERLRHRYYISSSLGVCAIVEDITEFFPVRHSPRLHMMSLAGGDENERTTHNISATVYLHSDVLGSICALSDEKGQVVERGDFDPWGKRASADKKEERRHYVYNEGFTGHEHLTHLGLIHMKGRIYDPHLGLFTKPDPFIQTLAVATALNRYAYVLNNPVKLTDPSGYGFFGDLWSGITAPFRAVASAAKWFGERVLAPIGKFIVENWKPIVVIAVAVIIAVATYGAAVPAEGATAAEILGGSIAAGAASGAAAAGTAAALDGQSFGAILEAMVVGGLKGAMSGFLFGAAGNISTVEEFNIAEQAGAYGAAGGINETINGGEFKTGFITGAFTRFVSPAQSSIRNFSNAGLVRIGIAALAGGTASVIGGGKFANGAMSAALARLIIDNQGALGLSDTDRAISRYVGKAMTLPYTAAGAVVGFAGVLLGGDLPTFGNNGLQFENNPLVADAFTLGDTINYPGSADDVLHCNLGQCYTPGLDMTVGAHEGGHPLQFEAGGLLFAPEYLHHGLQDSGNPYERAADNYARHGGKSWWPW